MAVRKSDFCGKEHRNKTQNKLYIYDLTSLFKYCFLHYLCAVTDVVFLRKVNILHVPSEKFIQQKLAI